MLCASVKATTTLGLKTMRQVMTLMVVGGQLGLGNDFDYWNPTAVRQLCVGVELQSNLEGESREWTVHQVSCGLNHTAAIVELDVERS
jgi:hypothetical protein